MAAVLPLLPNDPPDIGQWRNRLQIVVRHVGQLMVDRTIWRGAQELLETNPSFDRPPFFFHWITQQYFASQSVAVRRQMDDEKSHQQTMGRLLSVLGQGADHLTRDWFVAMYDGDETIKQMGNRTFDRFAGQEDNTVPATWFADLGRSLREKIDPIRWFVNKRVAHIDEREVVIPLVAELDDAIDALNQATIDLHLLLTASSMLSAEPTIQFNWAEGLHVPWWVR